MNIRWSEATESYEFDTGELFGRITPYGDYHGLAGLQHRSDPVNLVRPGNSFLNAEYYIRSGMDRQFLPRQISRSKRTTHELLDDSVVLHFPPEPDYALALDLAYTIQGDTIDLAMTIRPTKDVPDFEIFFASYVCESLDETWVPLVGPDGAREWKKLNNRREVGSLFGVMRDAAQLGLLPAELPDASIEVENQPFSEPILVARDSRRGLALVFLCDPHVTKYLVGQHHGWDTAHDWSFGTALRAGKAFRAVARLVCRPFPDVSRMQDEIATLWDAFAADYLRIMR